MNTHWPHARASIYVTALRPPLIPNSAVIADPLFYLLAIHLPRTAP